MARPSLRALFLPVAALLLFTGLAAHQLTLPGLHADEAQEAGIQAQQVLAGEPVTAFRGATVSLFGRQWPLMVQDYIGALNVFLAVPFFAGLGAGVFSLRLMAVFIGLVTVALVYPLVRQVGSQRAAALAALLLAVQPSFLFWSRQGVFVTSITGALAAAFLWAVAAWVRCPEQRGRLALAGFLAGLGLYAKLLFLWILGGVLATAFLYLAFRLIARLRPPERQPDPPQAPRPSRTQLRFTHYVLRLTLPFVIALLPLLLYNLQTGGTLASVSGNLTTSFYGVNNLDVARNLATRWDQLRAVLAGRDHLWYLGGSFGNPLAEWLLGAAVAVLLARGVARRPGAGLPLAVVAVAAVAFCQTIFTVSGLFPTHFAVLILFGPVVTALGAEGVLAELLEAPGKMAGRNAHPSRILVSGDPGIDALWNRQRASAHGGPLRILASACLVFALAASAWRDAWVDGQYHQALAHTGGLNAHSDAVYALAGYLDGLPAAVPVVALDWGIAPPVRFLTNGRIAPEEVFGYSFEPDPDFAGRLAQYLDNPATLYIVHWPQEAIFPRQQAFEAALAERGLHAVTLQTFSRRDGAPIFDVLRVEK